MRQTWNFAQHTWTDFSPRENIAALFQDEVFDGQHGIIIEALCAWLTTPRVVRRSQSSDAKREDNVRVRNAVSRKVAELLSRAELQSVSESSSITFDLEPTFFSSVYRPMGGLKRILQTPRGRGADIMRWRDVNDLPLAMEVARIFHHHSLELRGSDRYRKVSLNAAGILISEMAPNVQVSTVERNVAGAWARWRDKIAFLYAAHMVFPDS